MEPLLKKFKTTNDQKSEINDNISDVDKCEIKMDVNRVFNNDEKVIDSNDDVEKKEDSMFLTDEDSSFVFQPDNDISDMLEEIDFNGSLPTITERYFSTYYKVDVQKPGDDMCIRIHSNRICLISLAPSHNIFKNDKKILKVDYKVSDKLDRMLNKVSGKSKHGAQPMQVDSNICTILCSDKEKYTIKCCINGKLMEVNDVLLQCPETLKEPPHKGGYLALVMPNLKLLDAVKDTLLTSEEYKAIILSRSEVKTS
ncbi:PREDICTED: protein Simiate [Polistes dominula]|uniref:Protein Simiate n=1 Tax=Polistes dominula TaxID=743375 RepID=A0ABM1IKU7_POLDO|nr:PREDICTED: protein Simiate [Polistes dominula]